jgi:hypothetical protein
MILQLFYLGTCMGRLDNAPDYTTEAERNAVFFFGKKIRDCIVVVIFCLFTWIIIIVINTNGWHWCEHRIVALKDILVYLIKQYYLFLGALFNWLKRMASLLQRFFRINNYHRLPRTSQILDISHS